MTGAEIRQVLNEAVDYAFAPTGSTGSYPYAAGLRFDVIAPGPPGRGFTISRPRGQGQQPVADSSVPQLQGGDQLLHRHG